jgi:hypothetical protein
MPGTAQLLKEIADIMAATVVETFNGMFEQSVVTASVGRFGQPEAAAGRTSTCLVLKNLNGTPAKLYFTFDDQMLSLTARSFFAAELSDDPLIRSDIACAVANIVGTKVKNCLNGYGHTFEMTFPFVVQPSDIEQDRDAVHLHFAYNDGDGRVSDGGVTVNFMMKEQTTAGRC